MSRQHSDLTLEGLAERLGALERENEALRNEVAELRGPGARANGELVVDPGVRVSRRQLLRNAGAAAVAAVAAGTLMSAREAEADHLDPGIQVDFVVAHSNTGTAIAGTGVLGVQGRSESPGSWGVFGRNNNSSGIGVRGASTNGIGVKGESSAPNLGAVEGHNNGGGSGLAGVGRVGLLAFSHTDGWSAAWGRHTGNGFGVTGDSGQGIGVNGFSTSGIGGRFDGGKAQLKLVPKGTAGPPATGAHTKGEIYMDSAGALFVCTAGGTPGIWRRVTTTAT